MLLRANELISDMLFCTFLSDTNLVSVFVSQFLFAKLYVIVTKCVYNTTQLFH